LIAEAKKRTPFFNGSSLGIDAPSSTRRQFFKTSAGLIAVTLMPIGWGSAGCDLVGAGGLVFALLSAAKSAFDMREETVGGQMSFDNQTGEPIRLDIDMRLFENSGSSKVDELMIQGMDLPEGPSPVWDWSGLVSPIEGSHEVEAQALGEVSRTVPFTIIR